MWWLPGAELQRKWCGKRAHSSWGVNLAGLGGSEGLLWGLVKQHAKLTHG